MKTKLACILGSALLATSLICGGSLAYADALEAESSTLPNLAPDANAYDVESQDKLHCVLYSDGTDNCIVNAQFPVVDQLSAVDEAEPPATELAPAVQFFDAIPVIVVQSVTIAVPGFNSGDSTEPAVTGSIPAPSTTEPVLNLDANTTTGALLTPAAQSADAIVVAIVQSVAVAVPGQKQQDNEEAALTELIPEITAPRSILEANTTVVSDDE